MSDRDPARQDRSATPSRLALDARKYKFTDGYTIGCRIEHRRVTMTHDDFETEDIDKVHLDVLMFPSPTKLVIPTSHWDYTERTIIVCGTVGKVFHQIFQAYMQPFTAEELAKFSWYDQEEHGELIGMDTMGDLQFYEGMWHNEDGYHMDLGS